MTFSKDSLQDATMFTREYWSTGGRNFRDMEIAMKLSFADSIRRAIAEGSSEESAIDDIMENGLQSAAWNAGARSHEEAVKFYNAVVDYILDK